MSQDMFAQFKAMQTQSQSITDMQKKVEDMNKKEGHESDDRFYYPDRDKSGNGQAVIRFLPSKNHNDTPYKQFYSHGFEVNGKWFINECATTLGKGQKCPVCEWNNDLWNSGNPADKKIVQGDEGKNGTKRKMRYVANILVVKDPANPENEGKTFLFQFGYKIEQMIQGAFKGDELEGVKPINPFCMWTGADFLFKIKKVAGQTNYDTSKFLVNNAGTISLNDTALDDSALEDIWNKEVDLTTEYAEKLDYKDYEKQKEYLDKIRGATTQASSNAADMASSNESMDIPASPSIAANEAPSMEAQQPSSDNVDAFFDEL